MISTDKSLINRLDEVYFSLCLQGILEHLMPLLLLIQSGQTALIIAIRNKRLDVAKVLIDAGADATIRCDQVRTQGVRGFVSVMVTAGCVRNLGFYGI